MNLPKIADRLQPALLDRLRDDDPDGRAEPVEARVISRSRMRDAVLRDLGWLFNTTRAPEEGSLDDLPQTRRSVLNYGLPPLSGLTLSSIDATALAAEVHRAIVAFEPRILADTLQVDVATLEQQDRHQNHLSLRIKGKLWAQPVPLEWLLQTDVDLETGSVEVRELSG